MLGSLAYHLIEDTPINICVIEEAKKINGNILSLTFQDALPFLITGFNSVLLRFKIQCEGLFGEKVAGILNEIIKELCNPDPDKRGSPKFLDLENRMLIRRYVSKLALVVQQAQINGM
jgi:hypothetical protein